MDNNALATTNAPSGPIDYASAQPAQAAANSAAQKVANLTSSSPDLLKSLQQNLTSIFVKDNPLMNARDSALTNYLNTPSATRASLLPNNLPVVAGSNLNLSPTQQNAITQGRENAALVPLLGLNQAITGIYGNIPGMVSNASNLYNGIIGGAQSLANLAESRYGQALNQAEAQRQANMEMARLNMEYANNPTLNANRLLTAAATAARGGANLSDIIGNYGSNAYVTPDQLLRIYNANTNGGQLNGGLPYINGLQALGITPEAAGIFPTQPVQVHNPSLFEQLFGGGTTTQFINPLTYSGQVQGGQ